MRAVDVRGVTRAFGATEAVSEVSFSVERGEVFGLLGPNGAGKTTTIRLVLGLLEPDAGTVAILGGPMRAGTQDRIGYLPEERGLYQDLPLERCLVYLAGLKGVPADVAHDRLGPLLERFDLDTCRSEKIGRLSKGMQQKAQVIHAVLHEPDLLVIDEPFSGLDPLNTRLVKDLLIELRERGTAILMSTHQLNRVEELCDRLALVDRGACVLEGPLADVRRRFAGDLLTVRVAGALPGIPGAIVVSTHGDDVRLKLHEDTTKEDVLRHLVDGGADVERFEVELPSLDDIFVEVVQRGRA